MLRSVWVFRSSSEAADHSVTAETMPLERSMVFAFRSPIQSEVWYCAVKAKLSPATGCRFEVAAAAPAPMRVCRPERVSVSAVESVSGSRAEKNEPRPFTAACHRSSSAAGVSPRGEGQFLRPALMEAKSPLPAVS